MVSRNPFRVRTSEYFEGEDFLSLFGLDALEIFNVEDMWTKIQVLRSARGGGKTSILKIFNPKSLNAIYNARTSDEKLRRLYNRLRELDVFDDSGPKVLGVYLSLFASYPILKQLGFSLHKQMKYCYALISCRIILATIMSIMESKNLEFPEDLKKIYFKKPSMPNIPSSIPLPCTAEKLYDWASSTETKISNIIEESDTDETMLGGFESLAILHVIKANNIIFEDSPIAQRTLLMLDDVDKLTYEQRIHFSDTLTTCRIPLVWLAERLEALEPDELFAAATVGREYDNPIILEKFWGAHRKKFETLLEDVANKRAAANKEYNIQSFGQNIADHLEKKHDESFQQAISDESKRMIMKFGSQKKYRFWFDKCENPEGTPEEAARQWRELEILIEREQHSQQKKIIEEAFDYDDFKITSKERDVAEFYIKHKYKIPYYFGFPKLVKLASSNIQQFLQISSNLFDEIISSRSLDRNSPISPSRQEQLLSKSVKQYWSEIKNTIPHSEYVIPFLNSMGKFCFSETNFPEASYGPVTGVGLSANDVRILQDKSVRNTNPRYKILSDVISTCLAYNLLEPLPDSKQGQKGNTHLLLYLNRLLCFWYELPLSYGGWRPKNLNDLCSYYKEKFSPRRKQTLDFSSQRILEDML